MTLLAVIASLASLAQGVVGCIPGEKLVNNEQDPTRVAVAREESPYTPDLGQLQLTRRPDYQETQIYLMAQASVFPFGAAPVVPSQWCYDPEANAVRLLVPALEALPLFGEELVRVPAGAMLWVGYYSSKDYDPECIPGTFLNYLPGGDQGRTFGQQHFNYSPDQPPVALVKVPLADRQFIFYDTDRWIYGYDWCYAPGQNEFRLKRRPLRTYTFGGIPGAEVSPGDRLWVGYTPQDRVSLFGRGTIPLQDPDGKRLLRFTVRHLGRLPPWVQALGASMSAGGPSAHIGGPDRR